MTDMKKTANLISLFLLLRTPYFSTSKYIGDEKDESTLTLYGNIDIRQVDLGFCVLGRVDKLHAEEGAPVNPRQFVAELPLKQFIRDTDNLLINIGNL